MAPDYEFTKAAGCWLCVPNSREAAAYLHEQQGGQYPWVGEALVIFDRSDVDELAGRLEDDGFRVWV